MSGLSLAARPLLAGAGRHTAQTRLFARFCVRLSCVPAFGVSPCFASCRSPLLGTRVPALTHLLAPTRLVWAFFVCSLGGVPCWGLLWACLLGGWLGFVFTRGACSCGCLRACLCALAWGWWGVVCPAAPARACLLACLLAHALAWACWRVRRSLGCGVTVMGRDMIVPPHAVWRALSPPLRARGERKRVVGARPEW